MDSTSSSLVDRKSDEMISIKQHRSLLEKQRNHYEELIENLEQELDSIRKPVSYQENNTVQKYDLHQSRKSTKRRSSVVLDSLIGMNIDVEDNISEDDYDSDSDSDSDGKITQNAHDRRATSMIIEDLVGIDDDSSDNSSSGSSSSSSSNSPQNANASMDAIALEQQLLDFQYKEITDVHKLKEIIETLKLELKRARIDSVHIRQKKNQDVYRLKEETIDLETELSNERTETRKYKHLLRLSQQLESIPPDLFLSNGFAPSEPSQTFIIYSDQEMDRLLQSKFNLITNLSQEIDKMRAIIKKQQTLIDLFNNNRIGKI